MPIAHQECETYRFGTFDLQPTERRLLSDGIPVPLTPKVFGLLELLVSRAGQLVSKEELLATLWPNRFVLESNLTKQIWFLRKALGDGEEGGRYIETVPKVGYRFISPVTHNPAAHQAVAPFVSGTVPISAEPGRSSSAPNMGVDQTERQWSLHRKSHYLGVRRPRRHSRNRNMVDLEERAVRVALVFTPVRKSCRRRRIR